MDDFINLICPDSPSVWDGNGLSKCFGNTLLGFGPNSVTLGVFFVLGITQKTGRRSWRMNFSERFFLHVLPAIAACLAFFDIALLIKRDSAGVLIGQHEWFFRCSQFAVWVFQCLPYILQPHHVFLVACENAFGMLHMFTTYPSLEVLLSLKEICNVSLEVIFGISINIVRIKRASSNRSSHCLLEYWSNHINDYFGEDHR